jgi:3-hydroxybutyryl-CoA dehydrogenase
VIGVVGAGTMGSGIAELACLAGARTLLHDAVPEALEAGAERIKTDLARSVERGRLSEEEADGALGRVTPVSELAGLAPCELVIEAAPESLDLKRELFARLSSDVVSPDCVLATNTSSLPVTEIASAVRGPGRVVGMHFFNPAPRMRLLEVVAGEQSSPQALRLARAAGEAMGKRVIDAADGPGFLVNRCSRPYGLEATRLLVEGVASVEEIDRICRLGGGFRMGPFELADLVGLDTRLSVERSFYEQSYGEPRWRPSPITARLVAAGRLGRKSGRGFYDYRDGRYREEDPEPLPVGGGDGPVVIAGETVLASELREAAATAGWEVAAPGSAGEVPALIVDVTGDDEPEAPLQGGHQAICCFTGSLTALDPGGAAVGFHALPPLSESRLVELTRGPDTSNAAAGAAERFFGSLGKQMAWVGDCPGLVLGRIVAQLVNEAAFALTERVGSAEDIDAGLVHGLNYPRGALGWGDQIGLDHVLSILDGLFEERHEERYRAAPLLRAHVWSGRFGRSTGEGFFSYG